MNPGQITDPEALEPYLLGGHATVTLVSKTTGNRFTYKIVPLRVGPRRPHETEKEFRARQEKAKKGPRFVKVMTGPDNETHYRYLGHLTEDRKFRLDRRSEFPAATPSVSAWCWFWEAVRTKSDKLNQCEAWHDGRCGRCGRKLTVPESISTGLGPICAGK